MSIMDGELDYIISAYSTLKLSGAGSVTVNGALIGSPLKSISQSHSPRKLQNVSPGKRSSAIIKSSPHEISKICWSAIDLGLNRLNKMHEISNSLVRLISSSFAQLYSLDIEDRKEQISKKHQMYIVRLIDLETPSLTFKLSSRELISLYINNYNPNPDSAKAIDFTDILSLECPMSLKFFVMQIIFKKFHQRKYDNETTDKLLDFLLNSSTYSDSLTENQRIVLMRLLLSFAKFSPDDHFKQSVNLKFLHFLDQFDLQFDSFITNISKSEYIKKIEIELMTIKEFGKIPFFLFEYSMADKSQNFSKVTEFYQQILQDNEQYQTVDWKLVNYDSSSCKRLLKLLNLSNINTKILWNELNNLGKPNAATIENLGKYIIASLDKPDSSLEPIIEYYIKHTTQLQKPVLEVLDKFIIISKNFVSSPQFIQTCFLRLQPLFLKHKQFKRLKNISNLFYNFASKLSDKGFQKDFAINSLLIETLVYKNNPSSSDLPSKFEKCLKLLQANSIPTGGVFNVIFNKDMLDSFQGSTLLHKIDLVQKSFGTPAAFINLFKLDLSFLSEEYKTIVFALASKYSTDDLHAFYYTLDINEPILRMLCATFFQQLPVVKPQPSTKKVSTFNLTGADSLIKSCYYLTQEVRSKLTSNLTKIVSLYTQDWINRHKFTITSFEYQFLTKLVDYLKFVNFQKSLKSLLASLQKYKSFENEAFNEWLKLIELDNKLTLGDYLQVSVDFINSVIAKSKFNKPQTDCLIKALSYQVLKLHYFLITSNKQKLIETSDSILEIITENESLLYTHNEAGHPRGRFIEVLMLLVRLHYFRAKTLNYLGEHLESLLSFCTVIRLSKSILKQNVEKFEILTMMSSGFRYMIKTLIHLGISKDAAYYSEQLSKFNESVSKNKVVFIQNCYFLCYYNFVVGNIESCQEIKLKANKIFESLSLIKADEYIDNYKLIYYKYISNIYFSSDEELHDLQQKLKNFLNFMDHEFKTLSINWKLNYEYVFNSDISFKNTNNPYINSMDLMVTSRKLFIDAQSSLNIDPLFSTLEDSAMSIPSAHREDGDIILHPLKSKIKNMKNVKKSIMSLKQSKDICLGLFQDLRYLSNYHIDEVHKILSLDLLTLSSISNSYHYESIEDSYKLNDYLKNQPLINEKQMIDVTAQDDTKSLIPNFSFDSLKHTMNEINESTVDSELLNKIPEDWLVITIDICSFNGDLIISNFEKGLKTPTFLRLPLSRHSSRTIDEESFSFADAITELNSIIEKSNATTCKERTSSINTSEERKKWHEERFKLDKSLKQLLTKIEYTWIGGFKGIFNQEKISDEQIRFFKNKFLNIIRENIPSRSQKNQTHNSVKPVEIDDFVIKLFLKLGDPSKLLNTELLEDLIYFVLDILLFHGEENAYDEIDIDNMYVQVENLINEYIQSNQNPKKNKHTVLILGKECLLIPWESLPCLRNTSTTRMPSLSYLLKLFNENPNLFINKRNGSFILNPSGDLTRTEDRFKDKFEELSNKLNWNGITGMKPTEVQFEESLNSDLFVYIGHGGGEQFIRSTTLKKRSSIAPSLLLGCSSASLKNNNLLEPSGTVYSYLIGGCPMIVGNLWDVTDKDIDKFSFSLFGKWGLFEENDEEKEQSQMMDICDAVRESRDACNLKYLNGAAPVVYGLPLTLL